MKKLYFNLNYPVKSKLHKINKYRLEFYRELYLKFEPNSTHKKSNNNASLLVFIDSLYYFSFTRASILRLIRDKTNMIYIYKTSLSRVSLSLSPFLR